MKRLMRFSLRTFFLAVFLLAVACAWVANEHAAFQKEQVALSKIKESVNQSRAQFRTERIENFDDKISIFM